MRQNSRFILIPLTALILFSVTSAVFAQQAGKARVQQGQASQPAARQPAQQKAPTQPVRAAAIDNKKQPPKSDTKSNEEDDPQAAQQPQQKPAAQPVDPALDALLVKWEAESAKIKSLHGQQFRSEINRVFDVEVVSQGPFFMEIPDKGRIDMLANKSLDGKPGRLKNANEEPIKMESKKSERWICTGTEILMINEVERTYQKEPIPKEQQGKNIIHSPLPFLFGMKAEEAKGRYLLTLVKEKETKTQYVLLVEPKMQKDRQNYRIAQVKLNKKTFLPDEVRMIDDTNLEIVYRFQDVEVNDKDPRNAMQRLFLVKENPYQPNLRPYKEVIPSDDPITERENRQVQPPLVQKAQQRGSAQQVKNEEPATKGPNASKPKAPLQRPDGGKK